MIKKSNIILILIMILLVGMAAADPATPTDMRETPHVQVRIWMEYDVPIHIGDTVTIYSEVIGGEGQALRYQWQYLENSEAEWQDIEGANEPIYSFTVDIKNAKYFYRLEVFHCFIEEAE